MRRKYVLRSAPSTEPIVLIEFCHLVHNLIPGQCCLTVPQPLSPNVCTYDHVPVCMVLPLMHCFVSVMSPEHGSDAQFSYSCWAAVAVPRADHSDDHHHRQITTPFLLPHLTELQCRALCAACAHGMIPVVMYCGAGQHQQPSELCSNSHQLT